MKPKTSKKAPTVSSKLVETLNTEVSPKKQVRQRKVTENQVMNAVLDKKFKDLYGEKASQKAWDILQFDTDDIEVPQLRKVEPYCFDCFDSEFEGGCANCKKPINWYLVALLIGTLLVIAY